MARTGALARSRRGAITALASEPATARAHSKRISWQSRAFGLCRARVVGGVVLIGKGKHDAATPAIERRLGRLLSLYALRRNLELVAARATSE